MKDDLDSDTLIAELSKKNMPKEVRSKDENDIIDSVLEESKNKDLEATVVEIGV